jgi:adenylate cyclase
VGAYSTSEVEARAGVEPGYVGRLVARGVVARDADGRFSAGDVRRVRLVAALDRAGIPIDGVAEAIRRGQISLAFMDQSFYDRFAPLTSVTFETLAGHSGVPLDLLMVVREAIGFGQPEPNDRVREDEQQLAAVVVRLLEVGTRPAVIERMLRTWGESLRRIAEMEGEWWLNEVERPFREAGMSEGEILEQANRLSPELAAVTDRAVVTILHAQHEHAATKNIIEDIESALTKAGVHSRLEHTPAICFLDITGYTRLTEERGDAAAADLAARLGRLVRQSAARHAGKPVKWLGDGVMFHFPDPAAGVLAALEMVRGVADGGLPPAHVGLDAGPVLYQEGDYFGRTVNVAARIAEYARAGEVLVTSAVVEAARRADIAFASIGPVELKGVAEALELHVARLA